MSHENLSAVEINALKMISRGMHVPQSVVAELDRAGLIRTFKAGSKLVPLYVTPKAVQILLEVSE